MSATSVGAASSGECLRSKGRYGSCGRQVKLLSPSYHGPYLSALETRFMTKRYTNRRSLPLRWKIYRQRRPVSGRTRFLLRPRRGAEYCDQLVCLSVCVSVCLSVREHISETAKPIFTKVLCRSLWPWLRPVLAALRYVMHFYFNG